MDKNSIIGLSIIGLLVVALSIYNQPSAKEMEAMKHREDSIEKVNKEKAAADTRKQIQATTVDTTSATVALSDSARSAMEREKYGDFASAVSGTEQFITLENKLIKVQISSKGGKVKSVELKNYKTFNQKPLLLLNGDSSKFNLSLSSQNRIINTEDFYFTAAGTSGSKNSASLRLMAGDGKYLEFVYTLPEDSYMLDYKVNVVGLQNVIAENASFINLEWKDYDLKKEKAIKNERMASTIYYRFTDDDVDYINEAKSEKKDLKTKTHWLAFKQQIF